MPPGAPPHPPRPPRRLKVGPMGASESAPCARKRRQAGRGGARVAWVVRCACRRRSRSQLRVRSVARASARRAGTRSRPARGQRARPGRRDPPAGRVDWAKLERRRRGHWGWARPASGEVIRRGATASRPPLSAFDCRVCPGRPGQMLVVRVQTAEFSCMDTPNLDPWILIHRASYT